MIKRNIESFVLITVVLSLVNCGLFGDGCSGAHYEGVDSSSGVRIVDDINSWKSEASPTCDSFTDNPKLISPTGKVFEPENGNISFPLSVSKEIVALFPDIQAIIDPNVEFFVEFSSHTNSPSYENKKTFTLTFGKTFTLEVLATKDIEITRG